MHIQVNAPHVSVRRQTDEKLTLLLLLLAPPGTALNKIMLRRRL